MRLLVLQFQGLFLEEQIEHYRSVPFFDGSKCEGGHFKSNRYIFEKSVSCPVEEHRNSKKYGKDLFGIQVIQLSNMIAFFDQRNNLYWVTKNRYTGELGWLSLESFKELVLKEINPDSIIGM